jgi:protein ImuB
MHPLTPRAAADTAYELPAPAAPASRPPGDPAAAAPHALRHLPRAAAAQLWAAVHLPGPEAAEKLAPLASACQRFTPRVSLVPPDGLLLEVQGSLQLFAGVAGLSVALTEECRRLSTCPVIAFAPLPLAALTAARAGKPLVITSLAQLTGQLAPLPLRALCWPEETLARLARVGVRTIGAVLRLPRAAFARRFGAAQLAMLDALTGRAPQVHASFRPPERFRRRRELDYELTDHGRLLVALAPLFAALGEFLTARQCGVLQLEGRLWHRHGAPTLCILHLAAPCAEARHLAALFGEHLQRQPLSAAVRACELRAAALVPHLPGSRSLWQAGEHGGDTGDETCGLIELLRARLGAGTVHGLAVRDEHRPESAWALTAPPAASAPRDPARRAARAAAARRPLWILPAPQPLAVQDGWPQRHGRLRLVSEPERIESGWWDGGEIARDYYAALDGHGVRLWVFRERVAPHGWFLHGVFG